MSSRMVHKGLFEVTDSGEVYRMKGSHKELAKQIKTGKDGKYLCKTGTVAEITATQIRNPVMNLCPANTGNWNSDEQIDHEPLQLLPYAGQVRP